MWKILQSIFASLINAITGVLGQRADEKAIATDEQDAAVKQAAAVQHGAEADVAQGDLTDLEASKATADKAVKDASDKVEADKADLATADANVAKAQDAAKAVVPSKDVTGQQLSDDLKDVDV